MSCIFKLYFLSQQRRRLIGEKITKYIPLPPFPEDLKESLRAGLVYVSQTETRKMNTFLKDHVRNITKDEYPSPKENEVLKKQVMARIESMKIPKPEFYEVCIEKYINLNYNISSFASNTPLFLQSKILPSLSASWRNTRNWNINKRPKYLAATQMLQLAKITG